MAMRAWLLTVLLIGSWQTAGAQIDVFLPDVKGLPGDTVVFPVNVSDVTGQDVRAFTFKLLFDPNIMEIVVATLTGTISDGSLMAVNSQTQGEFVVAAANARALSGSGAIAIMTAVLKNEGSGVLSFDYFQFNDGVPEDRVFEGSVQSGTSTTIEGDELNGSDFRVWGHYPEPVVGNVTIETHVPRAGRVQVNVFDMLGREVARHSAWVERGERKAISVKIDHLPQGTYVYRVSTAGSAGSGLMTVIQ